MSDLYRKSATECVELLQRREVSSAELVQASLQRIESVNPAINALPCVLSDRAMKQARKIDDRRSAGKSVGVLQGLPIAVKDYNDVGGAPTTYGSPLYADYVPEQSDATVQTLEGNGAIPIAKSNVPEWAGGHTFNPVYGTTKNPWDNSKSAGGSSGGSAAALASGMTWLATGNDLGGSLRTPAAFNSVVGLRPSPGVVPRGLRLQPFDTLWVEGPMARNVTDVALMLDAGSGHHPDDPLSFKSSGRYRESITTAAKPARVAFSPDLGVVPVAKEVANLCERAANQFNAIGVDVTNDIPDFSGVLDAFQTLRGILLGTMMSELLAEHREKIAPEIVGNIELGMNVTSAQLFDAERTRWELYKQVNHFFKSHDVLICPTASIAPFPADQRYVEEIDGKPLNTYIDWFSITFALTMTACPVLSLPCCFTKEGLPVAIQLMGRPRGESELLRAAYVLEQQLGIYSQLPIDPRI